MNGKVYPKWVLPKFPIRGKYPSQNTRTKIFFPFTGASEMLFHSRKKVILVDISTFKKQDEKTFAIFEANLEIITYCSEKTNELKIDIEAMLQGTNAKITYASHEF